MQRDPWDVVDEASDESFPASDPPAWGYVHAAPSASTIEPRPIALPRATSGPSLRRSKRLATAIALALGAFLISVGVMRRRRSS